MKTPLFAPLPPPYWLADAEPEPKNAPRKMTQNERCHVAALERAAGPLPEVPLSPKKLEIIRRREEQRARSSNATRRVMQGYGVA